MGVLSSLRQTVMLRNRTCRAVHWKIDVRIREFMPLELVRNAAKSAVRVEVKGLSHSHHHQQGLIYPIKRYRVKCAVDAIIDPSSISTSNYTGTSFSNQPSPIILVVLYFELCYPIFVMLAIHSPRSPPPSWFNIHHVPDNLPRKVPVVSPSTQR